MDEVGASTLRSTCFRTTPFVEVGDAAFATCGLKGAHMWEERGGEGGKT